MITSSSSSLTITATLPQFFMQSMKIWFPRTSSFFWSSPVALEAPARPRRLINVARRILCAMNLHVNWRLHVSLNRKDIRIKEDSQVSTGCMTQFLLFLENVLIDVSPGMLGCLTRVNVGISVWRVNPSASDRSPFPVIVNCNSTLFGYCL